MRHQYARYRLEQDIFTFPSPGRSCVAFALVNIGMGIKFAERIII
jgi:hypothetical protein